jgi:hypothetical protein
MAFPGGKWVATAWVEDVDFEEAKNDFPAYKKWRATPNGAVAKCGNGLYVFLQTGANTCAGAGGVSEWYDAAEKEHAARDAEAARKAAAEEKEKAAAIRAKAAADRAKSDADLKRREAAPLVRVTEAQARAIFADTAPRAKNDAAVFSASFVTAVQRIAPEFRGAQTVIESDDLSILASGPLFYFFYEGREKVRKFEPLTPAPAWAPGIHILVQPKTINAPDIEKIVVQRNGAVIAPASTTLRVSEMTTRMGAKRMIHEGEVIFPLTAFEPGTDVHVTIIAIPSTGTNITKTFGSLDLRAIQ